jgi:hypothetical protein
MNAVQAGEGTNSAGPVVFLLSRTGTAPGMPSATSTHAPPFPSLWLDVRQMAPLRSCVVMVS